MSFLSAVFIWALPLAAAPIVIHLLHRRQQRVIRWGAMQFLVDSTQRKRRIWRLDDWLLMLLRCAALLALVFALARPLVRAAWLGVGPQRDVILVLDASMSMGRIDGEQTPFDRLRQKTDAALHRLSDQDSLQVVLAAATPLWQTTDLVIKGSNEFESLRARLAALKPSEGPADLLAAIEQALTTEPGEDAQSRLVVVITDGRAQGMPDDEEIAAARLQQQIRSAPVPTVVNFVDVGSATEPTHNLGLDALESDRVLAGIGEPIVLKAQVTNYGTQRADPAEVRWAVGEETINTTFTEMLEPGRSTTVTIEHTFDQPGLQALTSVIDSDDELPEDNDARLILEVRERVPILIVASSDAVESAEGEARYALAALGQGDDIDARAAAQAAFFEPTLIEADELDRTMLDAYLAIVFTDAPPLGEQVARRLTEFVDRGGGLWLALGGDSDAAEFNALFAVEGGLSSVLAEATVGQEREDGEFTALHPPSTAQPAVGLLGDTARLDIQDARILRRWRLKPRQPETKLAVLLETSRGEPVAVEHFVGRGRVIVQAFPLSRAWSNLALCKLFVPYVQESLRYLVQPAVATHNLAINEPLVWRRHGAGQLADITLSAPLQEPITLAAEAEREGAVYRYFGTVFPGEYDLTPANGEPIVPFSVRRDPAESDLRPWSHELQTAFAAVPEVQFADDALSWPSRVTIKPASAPAWSWLLWALAAVVAVELAAICWFAWRKQAVHRLPAAAQ